MGVLIRWNLLGAVLWALAWMVGGQAPLAEHVPLVLLGSALALVPLVFLAHRLERQSRRSGAADVPERRGAPPPRVAFVVSVLLWALLMRLAVHGGPPSLSDDVYRYVWEGRVVAAGLDPYAAAPDDPSLASMARAAPEWPSINHPQLPAIYPPLSQELLGALAGFEPTERVVRGAMLQLDLVLIVVLAWACRRGRCHPRGLVLYAWHPLAVIESAHGGHLEPFAMLPMMLGVTLLLGRDALASWARRGAAFACWGLGLAAKFAGALPALGVCAVLWKRGRREGALAGLAVCVAVAGLVSWRFLGDGLPTGSLGTYAEDWSHFASLHALLAAAIGFLPARWVCAALFALALGWLTARLVREGPGDHGLGVARFGRDVFLALLVCSPVVHPWYGLWLLVWLPLLPSAPLVLLAGLLPLSYLAWTVQAAGGDWTPPPWTAPVAYGLPLIAWAWAWAWARRSARPGRA